MNNTEKWELESKRALDSFNEYVNYDYFNSWKYLLDGGKQEMDRQEDVTLMLETLVNHYNIGWMRNHKNIMALQEVSFSNTDSRICWFLRKIHGGIICYQEHGFTYTFKRTLEHFGIPMGIKLEKKK